MSTRIIELHTPERVHVRTGPWFVWWVPDRDAGGGNLIVRATVDDDEVTVLRRYLQNEPADDETLRRWAADEIVALADLWRPR